MPLSELELRELVSRRRPLSLGDGLRPLSLGDDASKPFVCPPCPDSRGGLSVPGPITCPVLLRLLNWLSPPCCLPLVKCGQQVLPSPADSIRTSIYDKYWDQVYETGNNLMQTSIDDKYRASMKITTQLDHISRCKTTPGTHLLNRETNRDL